MVPHHLSHSTTQISFFVIIYTLIDSDFQSECNGFIFKKNGQKLIKILYNYSTWITFNNVTWRYMCDNNRSEKPVTRTRENPHPWTRVGVSAGTGTGWPGIPQGYPCYSLIMHKIAFEDGIHLTRYGLSCSCYTIGNFLTYHYYGWLK